MSSDVSRPPSTYLNLASSGWSDRAARQKERVKVKAGSKFKAAIDTVWKAIANDSGIRNQQ